MTIFYYYFIILISIQSFVQSDNYFKEGFYEHDTLPGVNDDEFNTPFKTDTNRISDGVSSTSAYTSTSPRFPIYNQNVSTNSQRYMYYKNYVKSAELQGVALSSGGDYDREQAKLKLIRSDFYNPFVKPNVTFPVYAAVKWNPSNFAIQEGEEYNIKINNFDQQNWYDGGIKINGEGYSSYFDSVSNCYVGMGRCRPYLKKKRRYPSGNWMSLICSIGDFVRPLTEFESGKEEYYRWLPLEESFLIPTLFYVGREVTFTAKFSGQLICFANDAHNLYWNNHGQLNVTVTRTSWPPFPVDENGNHVDLDKHIFYEHLLLPSCDSARVVYNNKGVNDNSDGKMLCNPNSGGGGWREQDILATGTTYTSGAPSYFFDDLPLDALE